MLRYVCVSVCVLSAEAAMSPIVPGRVSEEAGFLPQQTLPTTTAVDQPPPHCRSPSPTPPPPPPPPPISLLVLLLLLLNINPAAASSGQKEVKRGERERRGGLCFKQRPCDVA